MYLDTEFFKGSGLDPASTQSRMIVVGIDYLNMIGSVLSRKLIPVYTIQYSMHNGPFRRCCFPASFCFLPRHFYSPSDAQISMDSVPLHIYSAPNNFTRFTDSSQGSASQTKIHRGLPPTLCPLISSIQMGWGNSP